MATIEILQAFHTMNISNERSMRYIWILFIRSFKTLVFKWRMSSICLRWRLLKVEAHNQEHFDIKRHLKWHTIFFGASQELPKYQHNEICLVSNTIKKPSTPNFNVQTFVNYNMFHVKTNSTLNFVGLRGRGGGKLDNVIEVSKLTSFYFTHKLSHMMTLLMCKTFFKFMEPNVQIQSNTSLLCLV
jgi:hypothetical protein